MQACRNTRNCETKIEQPIAGNPHDGLCEEGSRNICYPYSINRIKEQMLLFSERTSCSKWWPNQLRLLLSSLAYVLLERLRSCNLKGTEFARAQVNTIRLHLFKIGGVVIRNTRRILFLLSSSYSKQDLFQKLSAQLTAG